MQLQAAYHLVLCCYALGDMSGMRAAFQRLISCSELPPEGEDDSGGDSDDSEGLEGLGGARMGGSPGRGREAAGDKLREEERRKRALVQE